MGKAVAEVQSLHSGVQSDSTERRRLLPARRLGDFPHEGTLRLDIVSKGADLRPKSSMDESSNPVTNCYVGHSLDRLG